MRGSVGRVDFHYVDTTQWQIIAKRLQEVYLFEI